MQRFPARSVETFVLVLPGGSADSRLEELTGQDGISVWAPTVKFWRAAAKDCTSTTT